MNITYRNGVSAAAMRVLTAIGVLQQRQEPVGVNRLAKALGVQNMTVQYHLTNLRLAGLVAPDERPGDGLVGSKFNALAVTCRFYTYEQLNPKEQPDGTTGDAGTEIDGAVRAEAAPGGTVRP